MIRLFTALTPSSSISSKLSIIRKEISGVRWLNPDTYHCTLVFFGDTNVYLFRQIKQQLRHISFEPFEVEFESLQIFYDDKDAPHVLTAIAKPQPKLDELQSVMFDTIAMFHPNLDIKKRFKPHITLARFHSNFDQSALNLIDDYNSIHWGTLMVNLFSLFSSRPTINGSIYTKLDEYKATSEAELTI